MNYNKQYYLKNTNHPVGGFKTYENIYFAINVRKEKILFKKLLEKNNIISGKIELY